MKVRKLFIYFLVSIILIFVVNVILSVKAYAWQTILWPVPGVNLINTWYWGNGGLHAGAIDIVCSGSNVVASIDGTIEKKFECPNNHPGVDLTCPNGCNGFGNGVVIRGVDGRAYKYAHMVAGSIPSNIYEGATVKMGQLLGRTGETGNASGAHLHFGITTGTWDNTDGNPLTENYTYDSNYANDTTAPTVVEAYIDPTTVDGTSYKVRAKVIDDKEINRVEFPTWTKVGSNEQDDLVWHVGKFNSSTGYYEYTVKATEHNGEIGMYATHVYAVDKAGNRSNGYSLAPVYIGEKFVSNLGDFDAVISLKTNSNYVMGTAYQSSVLENLQLKTRNSSDTSQKWRFIKQADGSYAITSHKGLTWDTAGGGNDDATNVQTYTSNETDAQYYFIMAYNGGYRIVPRHSRDIRGVGVDSANNDISVKLYQTKSQNNNLITWNLERKSISSSEPKICYTSHVQDVGWQFEVHDGITAGTMHKSRRMEAIKIRLDSNISGGVQYRSYIQDKGWETQFSQNNEISGTMHESKRMEAIAIKLTGEIATKYDICYRAYIQDKGWLDWVKNGTEAGTMHQQLRLEAIQIKLEKKPQVYSDVENGKWYTEPITYMKNIGLMTGYENGKFGLNDNISRGQIATMLYRLAGQPDTTGLANPFTDVPEGKYYTNPIKWALSKGITTGKTATKFDPDGPVTRQELAVFMTRYAKEVAGKNITSSYNITGIADYNDLSTWARGPMQYIMEKGVITGDMALGYARILPKNNATRAEAATMFMRFCQNVLGME